MRRVIIIGLAVLVIVGFGGFVLGTRFAAPSTGPCPAPAAAAVPVVPGQGARGTRAVPGYYPSQGSPTFSDESPDGADHEPVYSGDPAYSNGTPDYSLPNAAPYDGDPAYGGGSSYYNDPSGSGSGNAPANGGGTTYGVPLGTSPGYGGGSSGSGGH